MKILYKFASRSRPDKFFNVIDNIRDLSKSNDYVILATLDHNDETMTPYADKLTTIPNLEVVWGHSQSKIHAINRNMDHVKEWDILVNMSDDMLFICKGFDDTIRDGFRKYGKDGAGCLIHYPDQHQGPNCMTMSIMDRKYYSLDEYIYYPGYVSLWCDLEAMDVGRIRGKYHFENKRIFNHYHPSFMDIPYDDQYRKTESWHVRSADEQTYNYRKANNFFI